MRRLIPLLLGLFLLLTIQPVAARSVSDRIQAQIFYVIDLSFVDALHGWALGQLCSGDYAADLVHPTLQLRACRLEVRATVNGGRRWQHRAFPLLRGRDPADPPWGLSKIPHVQFTSRYNGWIFGPGLYATQDGGVTWQPAEHSNRITHLATVGSSVWAAETSCVLDDTSSFTLRCANTLRAWQPASRSWHLLPLALPPWADNIQIVRVSQNTAWIVAVNELEILSATPATLYRTQDAGAHWNSFRSPCNEYPHLTYAAADDTLWISCELWKGGYDRKQLYTSTDEGTHWILAADSGFIPQQDGRDNNLPRECCIATALPLTKTEGYMSYARANTLLSLTFTADAGHSWQRVLDLIVPNDIEREPSIPYFPSNVLYFLDRRHGWVGAQNLFFQTADGGQTWAAGSFDTP